MAQIAEVRKSPIAGTWYLGNPKQLTRQIDEFLEKADSIELNGNLIALMAPHAGHRYSGATAGYVYRMIRGRSYDLVIILSPSHGFFPAPLITSAHAYYETPLGKVPVHEQALALFEQGVKKLKLDLLKAEYDEEHSIEIHLPFLQHTLQGEFSLLPIMMRSQDLVTVQGVAKSLLPVTKEFNSILIASSDLSHFYPLDVANVMDKHMLDMVEKFSPEGVLNAEADGSGSACGSGPIAAVLIAARQLGADRAKVVHYSTSADATGDPSSVVGYGAAVIYASQAK